MPDHVADSFARARAARARVVDLHTGLGPVSSFLLTLAGIVVFLIALVLLIPILLLSLLVGLIAAAVFMVKRRLAVIGRPNSHVGPVRTDGRDNVRVITRD